MIQVAAEVGGTFTDLIWTDEEGRVQTQKVPSTPDDPSVGVVEGLNEVMQGRFSQLAQLFHGSTVATNVVFERKGCRAALITTAGSNHIAPLARSLPVAGKRGFLGSTAAWQPVSAESLYPAIESARPRPREGTRSA